MCAADTVSFFVSSAISTASAGTSGVREVEVGDICGVGRGVPCEGDKARGHSGSEAWRATGAAFGARPPPVTRENEVRGCAEESCDEARSV